MVVVGVVLRTARKSGFAAEGEGEGGMVLL